jgi:prepilin-type processing-associated H-X9-DG protein
VNSSTFHIRERAHRAAVTLAELLVVIAILSILIAILLPAIQKTRESAARAHCADNLKKIGLALNGHLDANKVFPAGYVSGVDAKGHDTGPGWGWAAIVLPRMGQQTLFEQIRIAEPIDAAIHAGAGSTPIATYLCPSDRAAPRTWMAKKYDAAGLPTVEVCELAEANYVGVFGIGEPGSLGDGMLYRDSALRIDDIENGASHTLFVGERASSLAPATWVGAVTAAELFPKKAPSFVLGHSGGMENPATPTEVNHFSSRHPAGVNFAFVDGHVEFLTGSMPAAIFQARSTRSGRVAGK